MKHLNYQIYQTKAAKSWTDPCFLPPTMEQKTTLAFPTHHSTLVVSSSTSPGRPGGEICPWTLGSGSTSLCKKRQKTNNQIGSSSQYFYFFFGIPYYIGLWNNPPKKLGEFFHSPKKPKKPTVNGAPPESRTSKGWCQPSEEFPSVDTPLTGRQTGNNFPKGKRSNQCLRNYTVVSKVMLDENNYVMW